MKRNFILALVTASLFLVTVGVMVLGSCKVLAEDERQIRATMSLTGTNPLDIAPFKW
jgi:hypothetical protein